MTVETLWKDKINNDQINSTLNKAIGDIARGSIQEIREEDEEHKSSSSNDEISDKLFSSNMLNSNKNSIIQVKEMKLPILNSSLSSSKEKIFISNDFSETSKESLLNEKDKISFSYDSNSYVFSEKDNIIKMKNSKQEQNLINEMNGGYINKFSKNKEISNLKINKSNPENKSSFMIKNKLTFQKKKFNIKKPNF